MHYLVYAGHTGTPDTAQLAKKRIEHAQDLCAVNAMHAAAGSFACGYLALWGGSTSPELQFTVTALAIVGAVLTVCLSLIAGVAHIAGDVVKATGDILR